jgi:hypothetical protein
MPRSAPSLCAHYFLTVVFLCAQAGSALSRFRSALPCYKNLLTTGFSPAALTARPYNAAGMRQGLGFPEKQKHHLEVMLKKSILVMLSY